MGCRSTSTGPSAVVWGGEGITELAKEIPTQVKTLKKPEIKGGAVDGVVVGPEQVDDITKLPSREVLIGQVIGALARAGAADALALVVAVVHPGRPARSPGQSGRRAKARRRRRRRAGGRLSSREAVLAHSDAVDISCDTT